MSKSTCIILIVILFLLAMHYYNKKEKIDDGKESNMYVPNCNMLNDRETCDKTRGCYYRNSCKYNWNALQ